MTFHYTSDFLKTIDEIYGEDPTVSMVRVSKQVGVNERTIRRTLRDLGLKSYVRRVRALISAKAKVKRVERSIDLLEFLKENPNTVIIFSDKKIFTGITGRPIWL